jgi:DNA/RNA endonuclease G (NUC1)
LFDKYTDVDGMEIEPKTTINRNDQKQVSVPTAYYQALLRTRSGKSGRSVMECKAEELKCAAFIVGHRSATGRKPSKREMLTIAELERLTGLEFFANVKNAPKHTAKAEDWGL